MGNGDVVLAIDQGTTSSRVLAFDGDGAVTADAQCELPQSFPRDGWVEHDAARIWHDCRRLCGEVIAACTAQGRRVAAIGISNQRETTVLWERATGAPLHPAIVWQDRRTATRCRELREAGHEPLVQARSGLLLDPYFSASKLAWLLDEIPGARGRAQRGELCFGTIDSWLLWQLSGGRVHATDASNASRTMLFDIHAQRWDDDLLALFDLPRALLPELRDNADDFASTSAGLFDNEIPITAMVGDQQAAAIGQACVAPGMIKSTYGTGCFVLLNTGAQAPQSQHRLLTTIAYRIDGQCSYALEGSIFNAGTTVQWLRDGLRAISSAADSEAMVRRCADTGGVYLVPAFTGLGAPYWDPDARGAIVGLTRDAGLPEIVRAGLESVAYQTRDLCDAMRGDGADMTTLRVDGGMAGNDWFLQFLADVLDLPVQRPRSIQSTAWGAAYLAGMHVGLYPPLHDCGELWRCDRRFEPGMAADERDRRYAGWLRAVERVQ